MHSVCKSLYQWRCANFIILFLRRKIHRLLSYFYNNHRHRFHNFFSVNEPHRAKLRSTCVADQKSTNRTMECWVLAGKMSGQNGELGNSIHMWLESRFLQYANPSLFFVFYESRVLTHRRATEFPIVPLCPLFSPAGQIEKITSLRTPQLGTASSVFWFILCGSLIIGGFCFK